MCSLHQKSLFATSSERQKRCHLQHLWCFADMRHLLAPACRESPWIKGFSLKSLIASQLQGGLSWPDWHAGSQDGRWDRVLMLGLMAGAGILGMGIGKYLGHQLWYKCCFRQGAAGLGGVRARAKWLLTYSHGRFLRFGMYSCEPRLSGTISF